MNGTATLRLTASDTSQFSAGTNLLKAEFNGDDTYRQSNATAVVTVTAAASQIPAIQIPANSGTCNSSNSSADLHSS